MINLELRRRIAELNGWKNVHVHSGTKSSWLLGDDPAHAQSGPPEYEHKIDDAMPLMNQLVASGNVLVTETTDIATSIDVNGITIAIIATYQVPDFSERLAMAIAVTWLGMKEDELGLN